MYSLVFNSIKKTAYFHLSWAVLVEHYETVNPSLCFGEYTTLRRNPHTWFGCLPHLDVLQSGVKLSILMPFYLNGKL